MAARFDITFPQTVSHGTSAGIAMRPLSAAVRPATAARLGNLTAPVPGGSG